MPLSLLIRLSWRNLWRHRRRNGILLSGIGLAVAGVVLLNTLLRGMQHDMQASVIENLTGHVKVLQPGYLDDPSIQRGFEMAEGWEAALIPAAGEAKAGGESQLLALPGVAQLRDLLGLDAPDAELVAGWAARVRVPAVIMSERETRGVQLVGVDPAQEDISFLGSVAFEGEGLSGPEDRRLIVGAGLAEQLKTQVGRRLVLVTQGEDGRNREAGYRIAGIYRAEVAGLEKVFVFTGAETLKGLLDTLVVTELSVRLTDQRHQQGLVDRLTSAFAGLDVLRWQQLEPQAATMVEVMDLSIYIYFLVIMGALVFGLVNTLVTAVMERMREIGMLRALGMRPRSVVAQVVVESLLVMMVGVAGGLLVALLAFSLIDDGIDLTAFNESLATFGLRPIFVPVMAVGDVFLVVAMSFGLGLFASAYPAWRAARLKPLDAMRR